MTGLRLPSGHAKPPRSPPKPPFAAASPRLCRGHSIKGVEVEVQEAIPKPEAQNALRQPRFPSRSAWASECAGGMGSGGMFVFLGGTERNYPWTQSSNCLCRFGWHSINDPCEVFFAFGRTSRMAIPPHFLKPPRRWFQAFLPEDAIEARGVCRHIGQEAISLRLTVAPENHPGPPGEGFPY